MLNQNECEHKGTGETQQALVLAYLSSHTLYSIYCITFTETLFLAPKHINKRYNQMRSSFQVLHLCVSYRLDFQSEWYKARLGFGFATGCL